MADTPQEASVKTKGILTPQEIIRKLDKRIIGQAEAKRAIAIAFWKQQLRANGVTAVPRSTLLLYGPTGCGKTAIAREAARIVGLPFIHFDATSLSEAGYRGKDAADMVTDLAEAFAGHEKMAFGVIFLDEVDKLAAQGGEQRSAYARGTQHSLLRLIEGTDITAGFKTIHTEDLLFIFGGAFSGMDVFIGRRAGMRVIGFDAEEEDGPAKQSAITEDFINYGMEPELMGRITQRISLDQLTRVDIKHILLEAEGSVFKQYQVFFKERGIQLELSSKRAEQLLDEAMELDAGARGLQTAVENMVQPLLMRLAEWNCGTATWKVEVTA